jgi:hypothetical protein
VGALSLDLVNEFGRAVGNGAQAVATLAGPLTKISPVGIGFDLLHHNLQGLIAFLKVRQGGWEGGGDVCWGGRWGRW